MLQSRPITNLDNSFTDYELMHEIDSGHHSQEELFSRAHWGENFPGSSSYTAMSWNMKGADATLTVSFHLQSFQQLTECSLPERRSFS
jgi:hypothetical protein